MQGALQAMDAPEPAAALPPPVQAALDEALRQVAASQRAVLAALRGVFAAAVTHEVARLLALSAPPAASEAGPSRAPAKRVGAPGAGASGPLEVMAAHRGDALHRSASCSHLGDAGDAAAPAASAVEASSGDTVNASSGSLVKRLWPLSRARARPAERIVDLDSVALTMPPAEGADEAHLSTSGTEALAAFVDRELAVRRAGRPFRWPSAPPLSFQPPGHDAVF